MRFGLPESDQVSCWRKGTSDSIGYRGQIDEPHPVANWSGANLTYTDLSNAYLPDANLSGAHLNSCDLPGATLTGAIMPDGTTHTRSGIANSARSAIRERCSPSRQERHASAATWSCEPVDRAKPRRPSFSSSR